MIKLTDKFFEYCDLPREKLKERFLGFQQLENKIESKEGEKERLKEEQKIAAEQEKIETEKVFGEAFAFFQDKAIPKALALFKQCLEKCPEDKAAIVYLTRCQKIMEEGMDNWSRVSNMESK